MKLTKNLKTEILKAYHEYWNAYLKGDMQTMSYWMHENIQMVGSGRGEFFKNKKETIGYYKSTVGQVAGKADMRNRKISVAMIGEQVMVNEQCDFFVLIDGVWTFYEQGRISTLFTKTNKGWKIIQEHGSMPDARTNEGEQVNTNKIKAENVRLKNAVKRRTIELENKNRELEIEAALEKVRSSSLAMHRSDELQGVVNTVIERLKELDIVLDTTNILIFDDKEKRMEFWTGSNSTGTQLSTSWKVPYADFLYYKQIRQARENKQEIFAGNYSFEEKNKLYHYLFTQTDFRHLNPERKKFILKSPRATIISGIANDIAIQIISYSRESFTSDEIDIVKRFAKVFNQAYTRFLDLQKAEVQTREAQIQLALERVRAKSLAMHHSSELQEVANITAQQLHGIGMDINGGVFICINAEVDKDLPIWASGGMADYVQKVMVPVLNKPIITAIREAVKKGNSFLIETFTDKEKLELFTHLFKYEPWKNLPSQRKKELLSRKGGFARSVAISRYTSISITNHNGKDFTEDENEILKRFGKVFEQSYIRFLDLQKAEAQTREAQIEAGLERVRANAMAMQSSDELKALIGTVFTELTKLDLALTRCIIWVFEPTTNAARWWMTNSEEPFKPMSFYIKYHKHPAYLRFVQEWKNQNVKFVYDLKGADKRKWDDILFSKTELKNLPTVVIDGMKKPERILLSASFNNFGGINVASLEPLSDEHFDILLRFAKVFDLTYTRFLDLQKAEAQAIEAQIEASLERVRSRTMGMQKSEELKEVIRLVYEQFIHLKIHIEHAGFLIDYKTRDDVLHIWLADEHLAPSEVIFPWFDCPPNNSIRDAKNKGEDFFKYHLTFEEKNKFYQDLFQLIPGVPEETIAYYQNCPGLAGSGVLLESIGLYVENFSGTPYTDEENAILMRFGKVFQQTYTRFLDLEKAEAQARESQIQLALERVRARTMAMQKSYELGEVALLLFEQVKKLGIETYASGFNILNQEKKNLVSWMSNPTGAINPPFEMPVESFELHRKIYEAWKNNEDFLEDDLTGEALAAHYKFLRSHPLLDEAFKKSEAADIETPDRQVHNIAIFSQGFLLFITFEPHHEFREIFIRFAKVFEQTYTRFLDLEKAEEQSREARIEAALERVRSRTMAMQKSDELSTISSELFKQVQLLEVPSWYCAFNINDEDPNSSLEWGSNGERTFEKYRTPRENIFLCYYEAGQRGETLFINEIGKEECPAHYEYLCSLSGVGEQLLAMKANGIPFPVSQIDHVAFFKYGYILFITYGPAPEAHDIFKRFAKVFEQTYTRFLDLQKAEAQAREAQIEAALEKVRSRTMAMQHSDELNPTADILFEQLKKLGADLQGVAFTICDKNSTIITKWTSIGIFSFPYTIEPAEQNMYEAWKNNVPLYEEVFEGEKLRKYYETLMEVPAFKQGLQKMLDAGFPIPTWQKNHAVSFQQGYLLVITTKPFEETQIFVRFGKVFEQTYTRFLDLQKAETQAREAQIEAALEKVRSKAMSMHVSTELKEVASEMRNQLHLLGQKALETCAIHLYDVTPDYIETWAALRLPDSEDEMVKVEASYPKKGIRILEETIKNYSSKKMDYVLEVDKANEIELFEEIKKRAPAAYKVILESTKGKADDDVWVYWSLSDFPGGSLVMVTHKLPHEDERRLLRRFANVFGLAYQRFSDLQKAETSAREAIKQAALDRIRADIASMRTTEDLERITPVIWTELKILGISFIRCGVFIMDDEKELIHTFLSTPDGKAIAAIHIPYDTPGKIKLIPQNWRKNQKYTDHWNDPDFIDFANALLQQHAIVSADQYLSGVPHGGFYLHFVPFLQGMMYVGNTTALREEAINLIQSVADAFATAYARYEDFNKLEAAKKRVDSTLTELQATQKQLIQSEKMASLGELTAGIAHEIQNPLNFVNNFSEVSKELLDEMKDAMDKGETEEAKEIMQDVINNLEKINHHGKRADGIVKGMLQHSRSSSGQKELTDINALCDEYLRLSYHGLRAKDKTFNAKFETDFDRSLPKINVVPQEIGRVILNLINNAFYAVNEKQKAESQMQKAEHYEPTVTVSTKKDNDKVIISIKDNGTGIPSTIKDKIFQPFFTTKPTGSGTGLGLSLSYDIVTKGHGGELKVETTDGGGSEFVILLSL